MLRGSLQALHTRGRQVTLFLLHKVVVVCDDVTVFKRISYILTTLKQKVCQEGRVNIWRRIPDSSIGVKPADLVIFDTLHRQLVTVHPQSIPYDTDAIFFLLLKYLEDICFGVQKCV